MPTSQQFESMLTPAAKQALDELVDDYRTQLLLSAGDSASRLGELREISVHDVVAAVGNRRRRLFGPARNVVERLLRIYGLTGALVGAIGLVWFLTESIVDSRGFRPQLPLLVAASGFLIGVTSLLALRMRQRALYLPHRESDDDRPREHLGSYLAQWSEIEMALRRVAAVKFGESSASAPMHLLIERLTREGTLSAVERRQLLEFLGMRNALAHGRSVDAHEREMMEGARELDRILKRLKGTS